MKKKFTLACLATLALFAVCGFALRPARSQAETESTRIGIRNHVYKAPLEVVGLKVGDKNIAAGEEFSAGRDWIKHLTITVKNTSDRNLIGVGAAIEFPYDGDTPLLPEVEFCIGFNSILMTGVEDFLLPPGQTKELSLPQGWHKIADAVVKTSDRMGRPTLIHNVTAIPIYAAFSTTEIWQRGSYRLYEGGGKWAPDKVRMHQISQEVHEYYHNHPGENFKMIKARASQTAQCVTDNGCTNTACTDGVLFPCPTCISCPGTTLPCSPGWRLRNRLYPCIDINGGCNCGLFGSEPNYSVPCT